MSGLVSVFGAMVMPAMVSRLGARGAFGTLSIVAAIGLAIMGLIPEVTAATESYILLGFIYSVAGSVRNVLSQEIVQLYWRSATAGILILGFGLGFAVMALLGGSLISQIGYGGLMLLSTAVALISAVLMFAYMVTTRRRAKQAVVVP